MSVLVVGSVALDTIETPTAVAKDILGGSASYFSIAARHFEPVALVAVVGDDFSPDHVEFFRDHGVDVTGLETAPGSTFRWAGRYSNDLNTRETLDTQLNVFSEFQPKLSPQHRRAKYVFLANIHPELQANVLEQMEGADLVVLDTMNYWIDRTREALLEVLSRVDVVLLNDEEARMLAGESSLMSAARSVLEMGPSVVVVKKGEHGAVALSREFSFVAPAYPVSLVEDPTGAGDTFAGGFLGYLAASGDAKDESAIRKAIVYGSVMASFAVESFSLTRLAQATRDEVEHRVAAIKNMVHF